MSPVLNYFGFPGRGEATRVALAVAGVSYEDKRLSPAEFAISSFMAVPVYQVRNTIQFTYTVVPAAIVFRRWLLAFTVHPNP